MSSVSKRLAMLLMLSATAELTGAAKKMTEADIRSTVKLGNTLTERPDVLAAADPSMFINGVCVAPAWERGACQHQRLGRRRRCRHGGECRCSPGNAGEFGYSRLGIRPDRLPRAMFL
mmetsp:Transcript_42151/g.123366  ORF Transcript_42151/g.123366 Transcript_42151/m.123366 type:complete len:118 (-) Transcript_42151:420-773(-)